MEKLNATGKQDREGLLGLSSLLCISKSFSKDVELKRTSTPYRPPGTRQNTVIIFILLKEIKMEG